MDISESQYKFNLALDMIYYLTKLILYNHPNKAEVVSQLINKWDARINANMAKARNKEAMTMVEKEDIPLDVAAIVISAHQSEIFLLKKEFKDTMKSIIIEALAQEASKK